MDWKIGLAVVSAIALLGFVFGADAYLPGSETGKMVTVYGDLNNPVGSDVVIQDYRIDIGQECRTSPIRTQVMGWFTDYGSFIVEIGGQRGEVSYAIDELSTNTYEVSVCVPRGQHTMVLKTKTDAGIIGDVKQDSVEVT